MHKVNQKSKWYIWFGFVTLSWGCFMSVGGGKRTCQKACFANHDLTSFCIIQEYLTTIKNSK